MRYLTQDPFKDGYMCFDCGFTGSFYEFAEYNGDNCCPNRNCLSLDLDPVVLCKQCRADVAQPDSGLCIPCEQPIKRDIAKRLDPLTKDKT